MKKLILLAILALISLTSFGQIKPTESTYESKKMAVEHLHMSGYNYILETSVIISVTDHEFKYTQNNYEFKNEYKLRTSWISTTSSFFGKIHTAKYNDGIIMLCPDYNRIIILTTLGQMTIFFNITLIGGTLTKEEIDKIESQIKNKKVLK